MIKQSRIFTPVLTSAAYIINCLFECAFIFKQSIFEKVFLFPEIILEATRHIQNFKRKPLKTEAEMFQTKAERIETIAELFEVKAELFESKAAGVNS